MLSWIPSLAVSATAAWTSMRAQRAVGAWLCVPGPRLCSHTAQRLYCAYYQASVCNHILLESTAKFSTGQVQVSKPCPPAAARVETGSVACSWSSAC